MTTEAFAKVNLTLEVFGVREDGFHALRSIVVPVSLSDTVSVASADGLSSDAGFEDDLCLKAARALDRSRGAAIGVVKRIPVGGGLGGGSADAAATLLALNEMWGKGLSREELAAVGASVGSDVPSLVLGGPVLMEGRGEIVSPFLPDATPSPILNLVLCNPGVPSPTREVYADCKSRVTNDASIVYNMRSALESGDLERIAASMVNDLQESAIRLHPEIGDAMALLRRSGAVGAVMSGSGSTVFGLVPNEARGREIAAFLKSQGFAAWSVHAIVP